MTHLRPRYAMLEKQKEAPGLGGATVVGRWFHLPLSISVPPDRPVRDDWWSPAAPTRQRWGLLDLLSGSPSPDRPVHQQSAGTAMI